MTTQEITLTAENLNAEEILKEHEDMISFMAYGALTKIKKPAIFDIDDLIQEALIACLKGIRTWDPAKESKLSSWLQFIVQRHLYDIVWYSYRKVNANNGFEDLEGFTGECNVTNQEGIVDFTEWLFSKLSGTEKTYLDLCMKERSAQWKHHRIRVRQLMNIEEKDEEIIREKIKQTLLEK